MSKVADYHVMEMTIQLHFVLNYNVIEHTSGAYHVILSTLDGYGEENQLDYVSTENSAIEILDYCDYISI